MSRSKRTFFILTVVFLALLFYASYDIARRTTFPGSKPQLRERIRDSYGDDSVAADTTRRGPELDN